MLPLDRSAYQAAVEDDREWVRKKFFPDGVRHVKHAANWPWTNKMTPDIKREIRDLATNDNGLPRPRDGVARALDDWCRLGSWAICDSCHSLHPRHMTEIDLRRIAQATTMRCSTCEREDGPNEFYLPKPEDVPKRLAKLNKEHIFIFMQQLHLFCVFFLCASFLQDEINILRPLDVDLGPFRAGSNGGFRYKTGAIQFSWAERDVEARIADVEDHESKRRLERAFQWLMECEDALATNALTYARDIIAMSILFYCRTQLTRLLSHSIGIS